ncbi:MFS transporter [Aquisalimonas sp.]|uniref:MFS transporter n=1 Tax=Aquisalimonas sp. TaxID=1872621 RepID=UPI0025B90E06|nr:MFS transporter [Aquisalimonas sp.]
MNYRHFIHQHRRFLGFGALLTALSSVGQTFFIALFGGELRAEFELSNSTYGLLYALATVAGAFCLMWFGRLADTLDIRTLTTAVLAAAGLGCGLLAGSQGVVMLAVALFMLRLTGQGLMVHIAQTAMARHFTAARGKAVSVAMLGLPIAEGLMPLILVTSMAAMGWRGTWLLMAAITAVIAIPFARLLLRGHDRRQTDSQSGGAAVNPERAKQSPRSWNRREVLRHPPFYALLPAVMAPPFIVTALFFHQVPVAEEQGWSLLWLASSFPAFGAAHILSLLLAGPLVDRVGARRLVAVYLLPIIVGLGLLATVNGYWVAPVYLMLMGLSVGTAGTLMGALWAELYGTRHLGAIRSLAHGILVLTTAASPVLAGGMLDAGMLPSSVVLLLAGYALLASLIAAMALRREQHS